MLEVTDTRIYLTCGDSADIQLPVTYEPSDGDKIYFRLKKSVFGNSLLLVKEIPPETLTLELKHSDTSNLRFSSYRYEVEVISSTGAGRTLIENGEFVVGPKLGNSKQYYGGSYEIDPQKGAQVLETKDRVMTENLTVLGIYYYEVTNGTGGKTVTIGRD